MRYLLAIFSLAAALSGQTRVTETRLGRAAVRDDGTNLVITGRTLKSSMYQAGPRTIGAGANQLPAAASCAGCWTDVSDAGGPTDCTVGGGTTVVMCFSDGATWAVIGTGGGSGSLVITTGAINPAAACAAPSSSNLAKYYNTAAKTMWTCVDTNTWKQDQESDPTATFLLTGNCGTAPGTPASGIFNAYCDANKGLSIKNDAGAVTRTFEVKDCSGTGFVQKTNADGTITCAAGSGGQTLSTADQGFWLTARTANNGTAVHDYEISFLVNTPHFHFFSNPFASVTINKLCTVAGSVGHAGANAKFGLYDHTCAKIAETSSFATVGAHVAYCASFAAPVTLTDSYGYFMVMTDTAMGGADLLIGSGSGYDSIIANTGASAPQVFTGPAQGSLTAPATCGTRTAINSVAHTEAAIFARP